MLVPSGSHNLRHLLLTLDIVFKLDPDGTFDYFMSLDIQITFFNSSLTGKALGEMGSPAMLFQVSIMTEFFKSNKCS